MAKGLSILNDPPKILEGPQLLHELIQWERYSHACAVDFTGNGKRHKYSYQDIRSCVLYLESHIQESLVTCNSKINDISRQHIIPVLLPQSPGLYISQLAILQSGGAFCPINLDAPKDRIKFVVGDISASLIITTPEFKDVVSWEDGPTVILVEEFPDVAQQQILKRRISRGANPEDISYVMYTSGSSGTPKGVAVSHLAASQSLLAHERHIPRFNRFLQFAAPSFDVSVFEIFFPLTRGSTLVGCNRVQLLNDLPGTINELEIDAAELTPTVVGSLLQKRSNAPSLKLLLTIGEMLTWPIVKEFGGSDTMPNMLYGMYGPTEAAIHCTIYPKMEATAKPGNIGVPFDTVSTFIAAASTSQESAGDLEFLPVGELGELVLGGPQLAQCYLNREEQNKAAFVHFGGKKYYRTGDKARQLDNGTIEILGRMSAGQVKLRGQRVELGEIEEVVYKHPGIKTVVAVVLGSVLIVFALVNDEVITSKDVMQTCSKWLPTFMVPSEIVLLKSFPYLPSGKVDKRKLESDYQTEREGPESDNATPMTKTEQAVKGVLEDTLGCFPANIRLAAAGIDSLVAIRVASKLRLLGFNVSTIAVLKADTLASLAHMCENSKLVPPRTQDTGKITTSEKATNVLNGHAKDVESTLRCTPLQSAMLSETAIDERAYRNWVELDLPGITDIEHVLSTLHSLADSNSILRTGFTESHDHDGYVQIIWRGLEDSQIHRVEAFEYEFDRSRDVSLHHPIRFQVLQLEFTTKVLMHIHHALYDAWSLELLLDDLNTLLSKQPLQPRPQFSEVVYGYTVGTLKVNDWSSKDYWKDHLAMFDPGRMPNFHTGKSPSPSLAIERLQTSILTADVETASRRLSASTQSLFQASFAILLSSYLGSSDVCFGTVFSGRTLPIPGIEDIAGPCLATLPIRVDVSMSAKLQDLVQELNTTNRKHLEHSTLPLREIKSSSGVNPRQPLVDTLLIWQQTLHSYDHERKHVTLVDTVDHLEFGLTLEIIPSSENIELKANYQQALFPQSQINTLLRQVEQLAQAIVKDETTSLDTVFNALSNDILSVENEKPDTDLKAKSLSSPVENIAVDDPDRPAIEFAKLIDKDNINVECISYSELNARANRMGRHLLEQRNVLPDELVCICMEKCIELYVSILATAKVGAGYLPLTPDVPPRRLQYILKEANVKVVLARSESRHLFKSFRSITVVYVDEVDYATFSPENISPRSRPEHVSYCVFTSGSTGTPKGVLVTQGNLLSNLDVLEDLYPVSKDARFLQSCSQAFDVSVFEIFFTWRAGCCLCSAVKDVLFRDIEHTIRVLDITHLSLTPTVAALIDPDNVPKVQFLVTAGEGVTRKVFNSWADKGLWQGYGPSETTNICTVKPRVSKHDAINNIGPPFKNTSAFVLSPRSEFALVPRGGVGEFCFGGSQIFRGYMDRSQEAGKIIEHSRYGRLYRSGDFGRLMPDGSLVFTGRKDDQVKIRGQRVELGEINNIMLKSDEVADCLTMVIDSENDNSQRLVCFWTSGSEVSETLYCIQPNLSIITTLYENLKAALPVYMVPSALIPVSLLPSTTQGKIDKRSLIGLFHSLKVDYLDQTSQATKSTSDHMWTGLERDIVHAVAEVTKLLPNDIGPDTSFFNLGIDSISAIQLSRKVQKATEHLVEISDVLKFPSVVRLAEEISSRSQEVQSVNTVSATAFDFGFNENFLQSTNERFSKAGLAVQSVLPCTPLQEAMLSAARSSAEKLYENYVTFDINGDIEKLQVCWREMVRRHEILRTCFVSTDMPRHPFVQVVVEDYNIEIRPIASVSECRSQDELKPPYALGLLALARPKQLVVSMHHALYDGVALTVLYEEIEKLYKGESLPRPVSFAPFLQSVVSINSEESDKFWNAVLNSCPFARFEQSNNHTAPNQRQSQTRIQRMNADSPLSWIQDSAKKHSTSLLAVCHSVWASLLSERLQEIDICFGNVVSGRTVPVEGIERLVAPCFNTIPARIQNVQHLSYLEAFRKFQALNADCLPFQLTPLRRIQSKLSPDGSRLFDTLFILQQPPQDLDPSIWSLSDDSGAMDFPIVCEVVPKHSDDTLEIILHFYTSIISNEEAMTLLESFANKLQAALQNPRRQLLSVTVKDRILAKMESRNNITSDGVKEDTPSKAMSSEELKLRDVISAFTDVPRDKIGRDVSIFKLGLDSINTVQVATRLKKQGHNIVASDILEYPTVAKLAAFLSQRGNAPSLAQFDFAAFDAKFRKLTCSKSGISLEEIEAVRPCTPVQQGMLAHTLHSGGKEYVNSMWFEISPEVPISDLKDTWRTITQNNEMLRTGFLSTEDPENPFVMVTYHKESFQLPWIENGVEILDQSLNVEQLSRAPWSLYPRKNDGRNILQFTAHHALYDAQSIQMLLADVAKTFASVTGVTRPRVTSMLGAILYQSQEDIKGKKEFWEKEENKIVVNRFPDLTPLRVTDTSIAVREIISQSSFTDLESKCRANSVTMQAAAQAAWARLLASYIGEPSTTFGMTLSGRSVHEDADKIAFPSIVTLPVRCDVTGTNSDLLARTMKSNALLHKHQFTPLTSIQKWAGYPEGKIFDTLFAFQKLPDSGEEVNLPWKVVREESTVDYAISLEVQPTSGNKITLRLTFGQAIIPVEHAELLLRQYDALLLDTLQNPQHQCDGTPHTRAKLLSITAAEESVLPGPVNLLHEFVETGARQFSNRKALEFATCLEPGNFRSTSWTYGQLDKEANRIADFLLQHNVVPGQMIAICFDKCAEASFTIIGILKAGCSYVALDPSAPADRLRFIVEDSGATLVMTAGKPGQNLKELLDGEIISLDSPNILEGCSTEQPKLARDIIPGDIAYCLYTSGTTGIPKGCLITHENTVQFMLAFSYLFAGHWSKDSKYLQFASFHFDVSVMEQFWSWSVGICVASAPRDLIFEDITGAIQRLGITHIDLTPSLARLIHPDDVPSLCKGAFITGGEQLKQEILDVWGEHACIYNGYGPTEVTIGCTMYPRVPKNGKPSNIGPAYINAGTYVLKPGTELPVLRGAIGELCVSGKLVGKGYLNRPDLTAERFPTLKAFNERVYRTGDLVRILHDGNFIFLGRADDQVKLRGQRLELSEINEVIKKGVGNIQEVVTLVLKHSTQQKEQLVTFFVKSSPSDEQDGTLIASMREACKARLPRYMVPTHFIPINALPLNANNKADSKQLAVTFNELRLEDLQKLSQSGQDDREWSHSEKRVLDVIANALRVELSSLTRDSNIFELGLDSISIIGFSRTLQNADLSNAKLSVVKNNPSMKGLVKALLEGDTTDQEKENAYVAATQAIAAFAQRHVVGICGELGIENTDVESIVPCTPVQEGMIYRFLESDYPLYFNKFEFNLDDNIDIEKLRAAWSRVVARLEVLRTKFITTDDGFAQVILKKGDEIWECHSLDYDSAEKILALRTPYSLVVGSSTSGHRLKLHMFHGLYDGNSLTMLLRRVVDEYHNLKSIEYGPSFTFSLPYGPLAKVPGAEEFWASHLKSWSSHPILETAESAEDVVATIIIDGLQGFEALRKKLGITPQALIQAAWVSVLRNIISSDLTIGIVTSGRAIDFENADKIIGPLFNTVPFHIKIEPGTKSGALISRCHDFNMRMQDFQHTPLKDIQKWSPAKPGQPLFDTLFVFQRPEAEDEEFASGVWTQEDNEQVADYPLAFEATLNPNSSKLSLTIVAQGSVFKRSQADELLEQVKSSLQDILESAGENVILGSKTDINGNAEIRDELQITANRSSLGTSDEPFTWSEDAEKIRAEIAALAKVPEDSIHETSSIFELGLDSIDVIKLSSRLRKQNIEIPVSTLVKSQTIAKIVVHISSKDSRSKAAVGKSLLEVSRDLTKYLKSIGKLPENVEAVLPATPLQQSMVKEMIYSGYKRYFNVDGFRLGKNVDLKRLATAVRTVIEQSPILRTTFVEIENPKFAVSYAQIIHHQDAQLMEKTFSSSGLAEGQNFKEYMEQFKTKSTELAAEIQGLLQVRFVSAGQANYLAIAVPHALYDGTSLRAIHNDIKKAYQGKYESRPDFMPFLEEVFQSTTEDAKKFWRTTLSNLPFATFPRKENSRNKDPNISTRLEKESRIPLRDIEALCKSSRITLQTLGQTCWALVISHLMGQLDVVFGSVLSCRDSEEAGEVMFPLMNTVAVRSVLHGSLSEMLRYMQEMSDTTRQYLHFPLGTAQAYALASRRDSSSIKDTTLFDTLFIYQGRRQTTEDGNLYESVYGASDVEFPVCVEMEVVDDEYLSWTTACKSIAKGADPGGIIEALEMVLERIIASPEAQTIVAGTDGISVCGLPKFKLHKVESNINPAPFKSMNGLEDEWSDTELIIRKALHDLSDVAEDTIQKDSTIFHLGLDSISVLKLPALLKGHGIKLTVSNIMKEQTVFAMAQVAQGSVPESNGLMDVDLVLANAISSLEISTELAGLEKEIGEVQYVMPGTAGEQYMIRQWQVSQGAMFYQTFTYALHGQINKGKLDAAWKSLLERHDILRTGFVDVWSKVVQVVFKNPPNEVIYHDQQAPARTRKDNPDLRLPPINLVVEGAEESSPTLKLVLHHALYDGISLPILIDEFQTLYRGVEQEPPAISFKGFVAQSISASSPSIAEKKWKSYLNSSTLYPSNPTEAASTPKSKKRTEVFHPSMKVKPLKQLAQQTGVSIDALFLAALAKIYAQKLQNPGSARKVPYITFGIYLANRAPFGEDLSSLSAPTLNLLPICIHYPLERDMPEIAKDVQRDIHTISDADMVSASLEDIYNWTGTKVNFFVNILKSANPGIEEVKEGEWEAVQDLSKRAEVVEEVVNKGLFKSETKKFEDEAYLRSVDIELRYQGGDKIDMGIFAPEDMLDISGAERVIGEFVEFWK